MRPDLKDSLEKFMKSIYIEDFYIYIIHLSNTVSKYEMTINVNEYGKKELNSGHVYNKLEKLFKFPEMHL